ncbi:MAG: hypothetical protein ABI655_14555, partial [Phenylobacterium sp.]
MGEASRGWSLLAAALGLALGGAANAAAAPGDWPTYGRDPGGMRYSPLTQITPQNVGQLAPAWSYHMRPATAAANAPASSREEAAQRAAEGLPPPGAPPGARRRGP